jgi:hypothetical protein
MQVTDGKDWEAGFEAGQTLVDCCPYSRGSQAEWNWHMAWLEGAAKQLGMRYCRTAAERAARQMSRQMAARSMTPDEELESC